MVYKVTSHPAQLFGDMDGWLVVGRHPKVMGHWLAGGVDNLHFGSIGYSLSLEGFFFELSSLSASLFLSGLIKVFELYVGGRAKQLTEHIYDCITVRARHGKIETVPSLPAVVCSCLIQLCPHLDLSQALEREGKLSKQEHS